MTSIFDPLFEDTEIIYPGSYITDREAWEMGLYLVKTGWLRRFRLYDQSGRLLIEIPSDL